MIRTNSENKVIIVPTPFYAVQYNQSIQLLNQHVPSLLKILVCFVLNYSICFKQISGERDSIIRTHNVPYINGNNKLYSDMRG